MTNAVTTKRTMDDDDHDYGDGGAHRGTVTTPPSSQRRLQDEDDDIDDPNTTRQSSSSTNNPRIATPEQDNDDRELEQREAAAAAAEVAAMDRQTERGRDGARAGDQAVMGATGNATDDGVDALEVVDESGELVRQAFLEFLQDYRQEVVEHEPEDRQDYEEDRGVRYVRPYIDQADLIAKRQMERLSNGDGEDEGRGPTSTFASTLVLNFAHVMRHDPELADAIQGQFGRFEPYLRKAVQSLILDRHPALNVSGGKRPTSYFIAIHNLPRTVSIRQLRTEFIGSLCSVTGTVTRTSDVRPELLVASFTCKQCGLLAGNIRQQYHYTRPTLCKNPRCKNKSPMQFTLEDTQSEFVDWQKLRVQEHATHIPPGSMPRSIDIIVRNEMVERAKAGDKSVFCGTLVVVPDGSALARAGEATQASRSRSGRGSDAAKGGGGGFRGLAALGVRELTYRTCFVATSVLLAESADYANQNDQVMARLLFGPSLSNTMKGGATDPDHPTPDQVASEFTEAQRAEIRHMRASPRLYDQLVDSIAPTTFGHREVKKGILLMLLGGVHKTTVDHSLLRGDINVCVVGDPSTAKSQFLKWVNSFWPSKCVYTSGKASSAAGLTAAVQRDQDTGEYGIEAGALMLADNGICCIDEFDKMDIGDQVAIHEAMEQQTISITKAGIQATLNARASILAAANPIYGRYDRTKTLKSNIALSAPILSRFDLFFVVLDDCNPDADRQVARHILNVHKCQEEAAKPPFEKDQMRRYLKFARTLNPKLTPDSQRVLVDCYRKLRQGDTLGRSSRSAYRITVRQLESMIRLSEAMARLYCADEIEPAYVREAFRLLKTSIIQVETSDVVMEEDEDEDPGDKQQGVTGEGNDDDDDDDDDESPRDETQGDQMETQQRAVPQYHPGEYNGGEEEQQPPPPQPDDEELAAEDPPRQDGGEAADAANNENDDGALPKQKKKKKKKTKIKYEEYEAMTQALAGHLRDLEEQAQEKVGGDADPYLTWGALVEWYLEQYEKDIGDSLEVLADMKSKVNLVIRRLINVDRILVTVGDAPTCKREEPNTLLSVHPNYEIS